MKFFFISACIVACSVQVYGQVKNKENNTEHEDTTVFQVSSIVSHRKASNSVFRNTPGSVSVVSAAEIRSLAPLSANEVFRKVAGVHVVDEEGAGMRINIGIRGMDPDRSKGVLVLEDGIPVALNPYGEPEMYYSPVIDRMSGVEVLKGSGQIMFGPQTVGGVVNYITANPSATQKIRIRAGAGSGGMLNTMLTYSNTFDKVGFVGTLLHKKADKLGYAKFGITDFTGKFIFNTGERSKLVLKTGIYNELSNSTYIGLTQTMYDRGGQDFVLMAPDDRLDISRYSISASHLYAVSSRLRLNTTVYAYTVSRNWQRQDFSSSKAASNRTGVVWGDTAVTGGAVYMRNQNAHRDRQFQVFGSESRLSYDYSIGKAKSELQAGVRYLYERAFEQRINGRKADARSGDLVEDEIRYGNAFSAYVHNRTELSKRITVTAGLRAESYSYGRNIFRNTFRINNVSKLTDTNLLSQNNIYSFIPGAGINYGLSGQVTAFAGVHRGFAPPRIKDAISNSGEVYQLSAELSWNYEAGIRGQFKKVLNYELTGFYMDFSNQIIPVSESSGGTGTGLVNGGKTIHQGAEFAYRFDLSALLHIKSKLCVSGSHTLVKAFFSGDRYLPEGGDTVNISGKITPYAPGYFHSMSLNCEHTSGVGLLLNATMVGKQYADALNTVQPSADGRTGEVGSYRVFDANLFYRSSRLGTTFSFSVKNLTDERYITSRRPQGIRLGLPRYFMGSVQIDL